MLSRSTKSSDPALSRLVGEASLEEFLGQEDAWPRIIKISHTLWGKALPPAAIQGLIREYDEKKELELQGQLEEDAKFTESAGQASDDDAVMIGAVRERKATFSSNELEDDHLEHPTSEISPLKQVHDSELRKPKRTKLMAEAMKQSKRSQGGEGRNGRLGGHDGSSSDDLARDDGGRVVDQPLPNAGALDGGIYPSPNSASQSGFDSFGQRRLKPFLRKQSISSSQSLTSPKGDLMTNSNVPPQQQANQFSSQLQHFYKSKRDIDDDQHNLLGDEEDL